jgi:hypothetical protein
VLERSVHPGRFVVRDSIRDAEAGNREDTLDVLYLKEAGLCTVAPQKRWVTLRVPHQTQKRPHFVEDHHFLRRICTHIHKGSLINKLTHHLCRPTVFAKGFGTWADIVVVGEIFLARTAHSSDMMCTQRGGLILLVEFCLAQVCWLCALR